MIYYMHNNVTLLKAINITLLEPQITDNTVTKLVNLAKAIIVITCKGTLSSFESG